MSHTVLAADIGGTKTLLTLAQPDGPGLRFVATARYANDDFADFAALLRRFVGEQVAGQSIAAAAFGVAGPRDGNRVWLTNRPWLIDASALSVALGGPPVALLNDLEASAHGVELLQTSDLLTLQHGEAVRQGPQVVVAAGTGLGIAYRVWQQGRYRVVAGEGGHAGFAPTDIEQLELWRTLYERLGRVSSEHVVSGAGLARIYAFLGGMPDTPPPVISRLALEEDDPVAARALAMFASCYGTVAGDHALTVLARGGVFLAGGIAPRVLKPRQASQLLTAFNSKGGHSGINERIPVHVVMNEQVALFGAALVAIRMLTAPA